MKRIDWLESLQVFLLGVFAPFGIIVLGLPNLFRRIRSDVRVWSLVWVVPVVLTLGAETLRQDLAGFGSTLVAGLYLWLVCIHTRVSRRFVRSRLLPRAFAAVLLVMLLAANAELRINSSSWYHPDPRVVSHPNLFAWDEWHFRGLPQGGFVRRSWRVSKGVKDFEVGLEVRAAQPVQDQWSASDGKYHLETLHEAGESFTRVVTPLGADPFLAWSFDTGGSLSARTFRVLLEMRSAKPIPASACRGVWLQEDGGLYAAKCQAVALDSAWKPVVLQWLVPQSSQSPGRIRVVLNDFDGLSYDVRRVRLEERVGTNWMPLSSQWLDIGIAGKSNRLWLNPTQVWQPLKLGLAVSPTAFESMLDSVFWMGSAELEVRRVNAFGSGRILEPVPSVGRIALWFIQPNLLGHTAATLLLCGLVVSGRGWLSLLLAVTGLGLIALTGSRTALLVVAVCIPLIAVQNLSLRARPIFLSVMVAVIFSVFMFIPGLRRDNLSLFNDGNATPRSRILQIAWQALLEHPFGLGQGKFSGYFEKHVGPAPHDAIQHAHNFWLELATRYGFPGLIAAVWISLGLLFVSWRRARWRGMTLVMSLLLLNITDNTLLYQGVFCTLILTLNALSEI